MRRSLAAVAMAVMLAIGAPRPASAALLWTLVVTPLTVATGAETTFTLTATNGDLLTEIGCVIVDVPANFSISAVGITGSTAGDSWVAGRSGNRVTARTTSGGDRLGLLQSVTFTVRATALSSGSIAWSANAFRQQDCSQAGSLIGVPPLVLVTGPAVTPTPAPTPPPTPTPPPPTPAPQPTFSPTPPLSSSPAPTLRATPRATPLPGGSSGPSTAPGSAAPDATPRGSASGQPDPARTPAPSRAGETPAASASGTAPPPGGAAAAGGGSAPPTAPSTVGGGAPTSELTIRLDDDGGLAVTSSSIGLLAGLQTWAVPAATIAVPGLLVLLWVALQAIGALAWVPATRRLRGDISPQRGDAA